MTRLRIWSTIAESWVAMTTVVSARLMRSRSFMIPTLVAGSRFPVGSSAMRIRGRLTKARAMATRCCSPPDSSSGSRSPFPESPTSSSVSGTTFLMTDDGLPMTCSAKATFSCTVLPGNRRKSWNTVPIWRRNPGIFQAGSLLMSLPATYTWPLVARYSRRINRRKVDLPDPEVPTRNTNSPFSTSTVTFLRAARCCPSYTFETSSNLITAHPGPGSGTRKFLRFLSRPRPSVCVGSSGPRHDARGDEKPVSPLRASVLLHAPTHSGVDEAVDVPVEHGVGGVHRLAARPGRPEDVDADVLLGDVDVVGLFGHGKHLDTGERGLAAALVVERRDPYQPVRALLDRQRPVRERRLDGERRRPDAGLFGVGRVVDLDRVAVTVRPPRVHAEQHLGEVGSVDAAGFRTDRDEGVALVVLARQQRANLERLDLRLDLVDLAANLVDGTGVGLLLGQIDEHTEVVDLAEE